MKDFLKGLFGFIGTIFIFCSSMYSFANINEFGNIFIRILLLLYGIIGTIIFFGILLSLGEDLEDDDVLG